MSHNPEKSHTKTTRTGNGNRVPANVKKEVINETKDRVNAGVENCDFPEEKDCYQVGGSVITASSTTEERKLACTEENTILDFLISNFFNFFFFFFLGGGSYAYFGFFLSIKNS